jgi:hypothetical protein
MIGGNVPKSRYSKGSRKALSRMRKTYGAKKGLAVFYAKANQYGKGKSQTARANSVYSKGSHRVRKRK